MRLLPRHRAAHKHLQPPVPQTGPRPETDADAMLMRTLVIRPTWCVDAVEAVAAADGGERFVLRGWAVTVDPSTALGFAVDGVAIDEVTVDVDRPDLARLFWYLPHAATAGFELHVTRTSMSRSGDVMRLSLIVDGSIDERLDYLFPLGPQALPDGHHRQRVHGSADAAAFLLEGRTSFEKLKDSLAAAGRDLDDLGRILDWGCGCGRLTRYFASVARHRARVTGIDIDSINVTWSAEHLPFGSFTLVSTEPPTSLASGCFDLIIGISVFTHLREQDQFAWLAELRRLVADDGIVWVTVHGPTTMARTGLHSDGVRQWMADGFADVGINFDIAGAVEDETYYRNVFHTHDYVRREWSRWFEVIEIVPGYIGNNQDLVMLRPV